MIHKEQQTFSSHFNLFVIIFSSHSERTKFVKSFSYFWVVWVGGSDIRRSFSHENFKYFRLKEHTQHDRHHPSHEKPKLKFHSSHVHIHSHGKQEKRNFSLLKKKSFYGTNTEQKWESSKMGIGVFLSNPLKLQTNLKRFYWTFFTFTMSWFRQTKKKVERIFNEMENWLHWELSESINQLQSTTISCHIQKNNIKWWKRS